MSTKTELVVIWTTRFFQNLPCRQICVWQHLCTRRSIRVKAFLDISWFLSCPRWFPKARWLISGVRKRWRRRQRLEISICGEKVKNSTRLLIIPHECRASDIMPAANNNASSIVECKVFVFVDLFAHLITQITNTAYKNITTTLENNVSAQTC